MEEALEPGAPASSPEAGCSPGPSEEAQASRSGVDPVAAAPSQPAGSEQGPPLAAGAAAAAAAAYSFGGPLRHRPSRKPSKVQRLPAPMQQEGSMQNDSQGGSPAQDSLESPPGAGWTLPQSLGVQNRSVRQRRQPTGSGACPLFALAHVANLQEARDGQGLGGGGLSPQMQRQRQRRQQQPQLVDEQQAEQQEQGGSVQVGFRSRRQRRRPRVEETDDEGLGEASEADEGGEGRQQEERGSPGNGGGGKRARGERHPAAGRNAWRHTLGVSLIRASNKWRATVPLPLDSEGRPCLGAAPKPVTLCSTDTDREAAVARDLGWLWRELHAPPELKRTEYNLMPEIYEHNAWLVADLQRAATLPDCRAIISRLRGSGVLLQLAAQHVAAAAAQSAQPGTAGRQAGANAEQQEPHRREQQPHRRQQEQQQEARGEESGQGARGEAGDGLGPRRQKQRPARWQQQRGRGADKEAQEEGEGAALPASEDALRRRQLPSPHRIAGGQVAPGGASEGLLVTSPQQQQQQLPQPQLQQAQSYIGAVREVGSRLRPWRALFSVAIDPATGGPSTTLVPRSTGAGQFSMRRTAAVARDLAVIWRELRIGQAGGLARCQFNGALESYMQRREVVDALDGAATLEGLRRLITGWRDDGTLNGMATEFLPCQQPASDEGDGGVNVDVAAAAVAWHRPEPGIAATGPVEQAAAKQAPPAIGQQQQRQKREPEGNAPWPEPTPAHNGRSTLVRTARATRAGTEGAGAMELSPPQVPPQHQQRRGPGPVLVVGGRRSLMEIHLSVDTGPRLISWAAAAGAPT